MKTSDFNYDLPQELIAQTPAQPRDSSRLLVYHRDTGAIEHRIFHDVIDNLILNNTVVLTMDDLDEKLMQRAVDTLSGAVFALHATIRKASERTYLIAPMTVEVNETYDTDNRFF